MTAYTLRITPVATTRPATIGTRFLHEVVDSTGRCIGKHTGAIRYGYAYVAVERRDPDFPFVVSFNRQPCDVESTLPSGMRCIAIAKAA